MAYHRNSIMYHLNNVHVRVGLNPFNFYDLHRLVELCMKQEAERLLAADD